MASSPVTEQEPAHAKPAAAPETPWTLFRGAAVVAVVLLLVGALAWIVFGYATGTFVDTDAKRVLERTKILADRNAEDAKLLHDPASWQDKGKGIVRVPIERAVVLAMADLKKVQPHPAYPLKQSPPQPANAPTAAGTKGPDVPDSSAGVAPSASNPTVGQPSPAPAATTPTPAPATNAPKPAPAAAPAPAPVVAPAAAAPPTLAPTSPPTPTPAPTSAPTPAPTPVPSATPLVSAPSPDNNANNPGIPPVPGTAALAPAPTAAPAPSASPTASSQPEALTTPPSQPTPASAATPPPAPGTPGASPADTP